MMDELKLIIEAIAGLPTVMVWVLLGYLVYKLAVIGSIYGLIRFIAQKGFEAYAKRNQPEADVVLMLDGISFDEHSTKSSLMRELRRLQFIGKPGEYNSSVIHENYGVKLLRETIDRMYDEAGRGK